MILFYGGFMGILWQTLLLYIHLARNHGIVIYIFLYSKGTFSTHPTLNSAFENDLKFSLKLFSG